jgi:hypothetical protein
MDEQAFEFTESILKSFAMPARSRDARETTPVSQMLKLHTLWSKCSEGVLLVDQMPSKFESDEDIIRGDDETLVSVWEAMAKERASL